MLSLAHLTILPATPVELIEAAAQAGFDAVGLRIVPPVAGDRIKEVVGRPETIREVKAALARTGLSILDVEAVWLSPETAVASLLPALDCGAELGARHLLVVGNDPETARQDANFAALAEACAAFRLRPMLEFIPYARIGTLDAAMAMLERCGTDGAGLLVDALHLSRSGGSPSDLQKVDPAWLGYAHLCDAQAAPPSADGLRAEARERRLSPGDGVLPLEQFVRAFRAGTPMGVEAPDARHAGLSHAEKARRAADGARRVIGQAGGPD